MRAPAGRRHWSPELDRCTQQAVHASRWGIAQDRSPGRETSRGASTRTPGFVAPAGSMPDVTVWHTASWRMGWDASPVHRTRLPEGGLIAEHLPLAGVTGRGPELFGFSSEAPRW